MQNSLKIKLAHQVNKILIEKALNLLLKLQGKNGAWKCWANDEFESIEVTAMVIHALVLKKPRGWELAVSRAKEWLLSAQDRSGYWYDEGSPDVVYLTVLVLDAIELASGGKITTIKSLSPSKLKKSNKQRAMIKKKNIKDYQKYILIKEK